MAPDCMELLFFDTFSHDSSDELNLDLVQFPRPVYITEVRIIPLGARVQADFPGGVRLGATNPSQFQLEFFVNDLSKPGASTFEGIGCLEYKHNVDIQLMCGQKIPTDGLVLRGWYSAITVAVYGSITKLVKERTSPPPPPPPQSAQRSRPMALVEGRSPTDREIIKVDSNLPLGTEWEREVITDAEPRPMPLPVPEPVAYPENPSTPLPDRGHYPEHQSTYQEIPAYPEQRQPYPEYDSRYPDRGWHPPQSNTPPHNLKPLPIPSVQPLPIPSQHPLPHTQPHKGPIGHPPPDNYSKDRDMYERQPFPREVFDDKLGSQVPWEAKERDRGEREDRRDRDSRGSHDSRDRDFRERDYRSRDRGRDYHERDRDRDYRSYGERDRDRDRDNRDRDREVDPAWDKSREVVEPNVERDRDSPADMDRHYPRNVDKESDFRERSSERDFWERGDGRSMKDTRPRNPSREVNRENAPRAEVKRPRTPPVPPPTTTVPPSYSPKARRPRTPPMPVEVVEPVRPRGPVSPPPVKEEVEPGEVTDGTQPDEFFEVITPDQSPTNADSLSDGEIHDGDPATRGYQEFEYEAIVSDEEDMSDGEDRADLGDMDYEIGDDSWNFISSFNPYQSELSPPVYFNDPSFTGYEVDKKRMGCPPDEGAMDVAQKLLKTIEQFQDKEHSEKWVETLESIPSLLVPGLAILMQSPEFKGLVDTLMDWVVEGLDFNRALEQSQPVHKVRHMKAGIRLCLSLATCDEETSMHLLNRDVQHRLLDLYEKDYMALSIKLLILRALDATTRTRQGIECLLGRLGSSEKSKFDVQMKMEQETHSGEPSKVVSDDAVKSEGPDNPTSPDEVKAESEEMELTLGMEEDECDEYVPPTPQKCGYQRLLDIIISKQSTRALVALSALVRKIHAYEVFHKFNDTVETMVENMASFDHETSVSKLSLRYLDSDPQGSSGGEGEMEPVMLTCNSLTEQDVETVISCLGEILKILVNAQQFIAQPRRALPAKCQFEVLENPNSAFPGLYSLLRSRHFLECLFVLLSCPATSAHTGIFEAIKDVLTHLMQTQHGLLFMLSQNDVMNGIVRLLTQSPEEVREDPSEENTGHQLGLQLVYRLQALQYLDALLDFHNRETIKKEFDDPEALSILQPLYTMIFVPLGRQAVVDVLSLDLNLDSLIPFLELTGNEEVDVKLKKSASTGYAIELLITTIHYSGNVVLLKNFGEKLLAICTNEVSTKLQELGNWVAVTKRIPNFSAEAVAPLCEIVKNCQEDVLSFPGELITAVRILKYLAVPPPSELKSDELQQELKYKYIIVQLFACDGFSSFITILQKICDAYQFPYQQNFAVIGPQWGMIIALVKPTISLIRHTLSYLISCRNTEFKDLTSLPILLRLYAFLNVLPSSSPFSASASQIQAEIIEIILSYTQPMLGVPDSDEALSKSLWTQMMSEVLKFVLSGPSMFFSGLVIISELLPLPLPIQTKEALTTDETSLAVNSRKLWSAHLHSQANSIKDIIVTLAGTSNQSLQQILRRVCVQLADLAAPSALVVVRSLLDALLEGFGPDSLPDVVAEDKTCSSHCARLLNLLAYLINQPCIKASMIHLLRGSTKIDEKYTEILSKLSTCLNVVSDKPNHLQAQECIINIFQSMCDYEITLMTGISGLTPLELLANALPTKDQMTTICGALLEHVGNANHSYATILPSLRTLAMIVETDFGFYYVKLGLDKKTTSLYNLLAKLGTVFTKESSDCISSLTTALEFFRSLLNVEEVSQIPTRTLVLLSQELSFYLNWKQSPEEEGEAKHPLLELEKVLADCSREEEALEMQLLDGLSNLMQVLGPGSPRPDRELVEPSLPPQESLPAQFAARATFVVGEIEDDRLSPSYWLALPAGDESDQEVDTVVCDLEMMAEKFCPGLDLKTELGNEGTSKEVLTPIKRRRMGKGGLLNQGHRGDRNGKKPFIAPMRGRGFQRGGMHNNRSNDPFRSRPPNTSRPPSMHVDDFLAMETFHPMPAGQANKRPNKETGRGRGRGNFENSRGFGNSRGRFFGAQSAYRRDDKGRGSGRGLTRGGNAGAWGNRNTPQSSKGLPKSSPGSQRGFSRAGPSHMEFKPELRSMPAANRSQDLYGNRFGGRGGARGNSVSHWSSTSRGKDRDRFSGSGGSGRGRREVGRHVRTLTR